MVVGYTEARRHEFRPTVRLSGTVEARRTSLVAAEVAGLVTSLDAREGDRVRKGAPLARLRQTQTRQTLVGREADLAEAEARLELARQELARARRLFDEGVVSRQTFDIAAAEEAAQRGRVESLKASIAQARDDVSRTVVPAPFSGVVVAEHTQAGEWLAVGAPVAELMDLDELEVDLDVPERYYDAVAVGNPAEVTVEALPGFSAPGKVSAVIPRAERSTRTFPVKVRFPNREGRVGAGMSARVELPAGPPKNALIVPKDAVTRSGSTEVVYRINGAGEAEMVRVRSGAATGDWVVIEGMPVEAGSAGRAPSLSAGDRVITRGNERIGPGMKVRGTEIEYELP